MALDLLLVASLLLATLSMLPAAAHLLELPNKIKLSGTEYLTAQRLYRGWAFAGVGVAAAWLCTLALLFMLRDTPTAFALAWVAFVCIAGTQIVNWTFTMPVNRITSDWTFLPGDWLELRNRWEYSQAASAILGLIALVALIGCLFWTQRCTPVRHRRGARQLCRRRGSAGAIRNGPRAGPRRRAACQHRPLPLIDAGAQRPSRSAPLPRLPPISCNRRDGARAEAPVWRCRRRWS